MQNPPLSPLSTCLSLFHLALNPLPPPSLLGDLGQLKASDDDDTVWYFSASPDFLVRSTYNISRIPFTSQTHPEHYLTTARHPTSPHNMKPK